MKKGSTHSKESKLKNKKSNEGKIPWNKGLCNCYSKESLDKMSNSHKGIQAKQKHPLFGKKFSQESKNKMSTSHKGISFNEDHKRKISKAQKGRISPMKGKTHSLETKQKMSKSNSKPKPIGFNKTMRLCVLKRIENLSGQVTPNYNPQACKLINEYGKQNGYNFQHAENGGEFYIKELGYWVDGYDKEKNIVIEVDEKYHFDFNGNLKNKDITRQKEIENHLQCEFIRIII